MQNHCDFDEKSGDDIGKESYWPLQNMILMKRVMMMMREIIPYSFSPLQNHCDDDGHYYHHQHCETT